MKNRLRDQESVFFTLTDENGVEYVNTSDEIKYMPIISTQYYRRILDKAFNEIFK